MPLYTYKCQNEKCVKCDTVIEKTRTVDDRNVEKTCECGGALYRVTELNSQPRFRGDGFTPKFHNQF